MRVSYGQPVDTSPPRPCRTTRENPPTARHQRRFGPQQARLQKESGKHGEEVLICSSLL